jgi:DnaJ-class molecular chaperone with C-terminal Zn finger domain
MAASVPAPTSKPSPQFKPFKGFWLVLGCCALALKVLLAATCSTHPSAPAAQIRPATGSNAPDFMERVRNHPCPNCGGSGIVLSRTSRCPSCIGGTRQTPSGYPYLCQTCGGSGMTRETCGACQGTGKLNLGL